MVRGKPKIQISLENRTALKPGMLYTYKELGKIFRVSYSSVKRIVKSGLISFSIVGKRRRFSTEDIVDFLSKITKVGIID